MAEFQVWVLVSAAEPVTTWETDGGRVLIFSRRRDAVKYREQNAAVRLFAVVKATVSLEVGPRGMLVNAR